MEHNIPELVAQLTLEEKAGLCSGADFWHTKAVERLGIPTLMVSDGPHGLRTQDPERDDPNHSRKAVCFPAGCSVAASFDPDLARREGAAIGREARAFGVGVVLGPAINIKRSPLCGRNFEYYSETRCWPVSWPPGTSMAYRARGLVPPSSILPPTARSTAA